MAYNSCILISETRTNNVTQWNQFYDTLEVAYAGDPKALKLIREEMRPRLVLTLPPIDPKLCVPPGSP